MDVNAVYREGNGDLSINNWVPTKTTRVNLYEPPAQRLPLVVAGKSHLYKNHCGSLAPSEVHEQGSSSDTLLLCRRRSKLPRARKSVAVGRRKQCRNN